MDIADLLSLEGIVANLKATSKKQVFQELAARAATLSGAGPRHIFDVLLERERLGTTGIGRGIAIPHSKVTGIETLYGLFARLEHPVDFAAIDEQPVDLVFLLLAPQSAGAEHLKILARISRLLRDEMMCEKLRGSHTADAIYALLTETASSHAA